MTNTKKILSCLSAICGMAFFMVSCATDVADGPSAADATMMCGVGQRNFAPWRNGRGGAETLVDPRDLPAYSKMLSRASAPTEVKPQTIGVYGFVEGEREVIFNNQKMWRRDGEAIANCGFDYSEWPEGNDWPYDPPKPWAAKYNSKNYLFYAYAPHTPATTRPMISNVNLSYENFNGLTLSEVRPIDTEEQLAASKIWRDKSGLQPQFTMEHLSARIRMTFSVHPDYDLIRDIRIREVKVDDMANGYYWTYVIDASADELSVDIFSSTLYDDVSPDPLSLYPEYEDDGTGLPGMAISAEAGYLPFGSLFVVPQEIAGLVVTVVYDVYDETGLLTRSEQTASNAISLSSLGTLERGYYYDLRIMVKPDYLYVLSDNDVAPDGLIEITE